MNQKLSQQQFFEANAVDGNLTDAQTMAMMFLPEASPTADTPALPAASVEPVAVAPAAPAPVQTPAGAASPATPEPVPVLMAKDGVHTIDYQKLVDEREARQTAQSALQAAQAELAALRATPATPASPAPATPAQPAATGFDFEVDLGDFSETAIANGVKQAVASGVNARTTALEAQIKVLQDGLTAQQTAAVESEDEAHFKAISNAHPDVESVVVSKEFASWRDKQPAYAAHGITAVIEGGTAAQVIEALNAYKQATGVKTVVPVPTPAPGGAAPTATTDPAIQAAAQAAINAARSAAPVSLSDIPAGSAAHHDPVAAILDMSSTQQMQMMLGKTPEQIAAIVDKCL